MTRFGFADLTIELDTTEGGALGDISAYVTTINGWTRDRILQEITAAGDANDRWADVGVLMKEEVVLTGPYDDTAGGLVAITKGAEGETRTLQLTFDGATAADVETVECIIKRCRRTPSRGALHGYEVTLRPTGAIT